MFLYNNNYKYYRTIQTVRTAIIHHRSTISNYCNYCTVRTVTNAAASTSASASISSDVAHNSNSTVPIETVVVTLLSPDPYSSRRMMKAIQRLIGGTTYNTDTNIISKININKYNNSSSTKSNDGRIVVVRDQLDESFFPTRNKNWTSSTSSVDVATVTEREKSLRWDSVAMQIQNSTNNEKDGTSTDTSGSGSGSSTILHWLSVAIPEDNENQNDESKTTNTTRTNASIKTNNNDKYNNLKNNKYNQSNRMIMEVLSIHGICYNDDNNNISSNNDSFITIACTDKNTSILSQAVQDVRDKLSTQLMVPTLYESTTTTSSTTITSILSKVFQWTSFTMSTSWLYRNIVGRRPTIRMDHLTINGIPIIDFPKQSNSMNETNDNDNFNNVNNNITIDSNNNNMFIPGGLKEVVIPIADDDYNDNDSTTNLQNLFQLLSKQEGLIRSVPGLYSTSYTSTYCSSNNSSTSNNNKHENNILQQQQQHQQQQQPNKKLFSIRPLPVAVQDQRLPPPTLIFHIPTVNEQQLYNNQLLSVSSSTSSSSSLKGNDVLMDLDDFSSNQSPTTFHKIGFSGGWNGFSSTGSTSGTSSTSSRPSKSGTKNQYGQGQILVRNNMYTFGGLDIRLCSNNNISSMFNEAQESLLASSLPELQSRHVSGGATTSSSSSNNNTDTANNSTTIRLTDQQELKQEQQIGKRGGIVVVSQTSFMSKGINNETNETIVDGDCWKEFRTVAMKNPMGYFWSNRSSSSTSSHTSSSSSSSSSSSHGMTRTMKSSKPQRHRIARAPDLPYE